MGGKTLEEVTRQIIEDVEVLAKAFEFVVPASVSQAKAILAGKPAHQWRDVRDPSEPTQVY